MDDTTQRYFQQLDLKPGASLEEVQHAYRELALVWHPDRFVNTPGLLQRSQIKMKEINEAYTFLKEYLASSSPSQKNHGDPGTERSNKQKAYSGETLPSLIWLCRGHSALVSSIAISNSGRQVASGSYDKTVRIWNIGTGLETQWFLSHKGAVTKVGFTRDNRCILSSSMDRTIRLWDIGTRRENQYFSVEAVVLTAVLSRDERVVLAGTAGKGMYLFDVDTGRELGQFPIPGFITCVALSPDGKKAAGANEAGKVFLYDVESRGLIRNLQDDPESAIELNLAFSLDGSHLITATAGQIRFWNTDTGSMIRQIILENNPSCLAMSAGLTVAVTGHREGSVRLWDLETGCLRKTFSGHDGAVKSVACNAGAGIAASGGIDGNVRLWRLER